MKCSVPPIAGATVNVNEVTRFDRRNALVATPAATSHVSSRKLLTIYVPDMSHTKL